jgi:hypothetical protein
MKNKCPEQFKKRMNKDSSHTWQRYKKNEIFMVMNVTKFRLLSVIDLLVLVGVLNSFI